MSSSDKLDSLFLKACEYVSDHAESLDFEPLVSLYGYYKQATEGPCNIPKPSVFDLHARKKWKSWSKLGTLPKAEAKLHYIQVLDEVVCDWKLAAKNHKSWVRVSSLKREEEIPDSEKDIFYWVKEGDLERIHQLKKTFTANLRDECGLTLLHWAADRGHLDTVKYLVLEMKADVNSLDEDHQTPLHYAAACGYLEICEFLINSQAQVMAKDCDGLTPADVAEDASIKELLRGLKIL